MTLALHPPFPAMEALSVEQIPEGENWQYEPKWDGFRCLVFRDGARVELQSKSGQLLTRYFPELVAAVGAIGRGKFVLDCEIVVPRGKTFSFDDLLQRIHPAASRINRLAAETPAILIVFDLLLDDREVYTGTPLHVRRRKLEDFAHNFLRGRKSLRLSPATTRPAEARKWLRQVGAVLDGIIAKRRDLPYESGNRLGMQKIKNFRSADCVVGGFRYNEGKKTVGSLLLGLYDESGLLNHVGFTSSIPSDAKAALTAKLEKLIAPPGFTGNKPGGPSRWSSERSAKWHPVKPKLVIEVCYDHFSGGRFRHGTRILRWRPDKSPRQCTMDQLHQKKADLLKLLK
ncbi:MAG TPA: ATP-dependent DNA ligase [Pseudolabrys sp.]|nr:ATP-dependent DNA ligase [Pseudolabrys sp.]